MRELSLNILDIAQNSIVAEASLIEITVEEDREKQTLFIGISDNGKGMDEQTLKSVKDPFYTTRTTRKVGMGIPLFKMAAEMTGGNLELTSEVNVGTKISALFHTDSIDFTPLGDIESTVLMLITLNTGIDFIFRYVIDGKEFVLNTTEIKQILEGVSLDTPEVREWLKEYISEQIQIIRGGVNNEIT